MGQYPGFRDGVGFEEGILRFVGLRFGMEVLRLRVRGFGFEVESLVLRFGSRASSSGPCPEAR